MGRDAKSANQRFKNYKENFHFIQHDISFPLDNLNINFDYIIHAASNATPCAFIADPVGTIKGNVWGCDNLLSYGIAHGLKRFYMYLLVKFMVSVMILSIQKSAMVI